MGTETFVRHTRIDASLGDVYDWYTRPGALERLTPPWVRLRVVKNGGRIEDGSKVLLRVGLGPLRFDWLVEHRDCVPRGQFRDVQIKGPFRQWEHLHRFEADTDTSTYVEDRIDCALPLGAFGQLFGARILKQELERLFIYRHRIIKHDIALHTARRVAPMSILVTGSSGLIGSALVPFLTTAGHQVVRLVRARPPSAAPNPDSQANVITWDPATGVLDPAALEGFDAVIHLAGETLNAIRWTAEKKSRIRDSRVGGTALLCGALAKLSRPPKVLLSASAIGFYGNRGGEILHEESEPGTGFLPEVCRAWEAATKPASEKGIRTVQMRFGVVISSAGGALAAMLPAFQVGLGGPMGTGWQYMSWITIDDVICAIYHLLLNDKIEGPVNIVGPYVATNRDFAKALGTVLERPAFVRVPGFLARLVSGEFADDVLLASARVEPRRLLDAGFVFHYPEMEGALRQVLGRT